MNEKIARNFENVGEPWYLYDSLIVCDQLFGTEQKVNGWFTSFTAFSQNETHSFFKLRTESVAGAAYNNQQKSDVMDYGFELHSIGIAFKAPGTRLLPIIEDRIGGGVIGMNYEAAHWWEVELPNHCGFQFKLNQDIVAEGPAYDFPPGYGTQGGGASNPHASHSTGPAQAYLNYAGSQGMPIMSGRRWFEHPIGIPNDALIEGILNVSDIAREILFKYLTPGGMPSYGFPIDDSIDPLIVKAAASRYMIQVSLLGKRLVQQRGEWHK
jgi:hypothetical protein